MAPCLNWLLGVILFGVGLFYPIVFVAIILAWLLLGEYNG